MHRKSAGVTSREFAPFIFQSIVYFINHLIFKDMVEKQITEKESLEVITAMIARTKERYAIGSGNIMLMWGYLVVAVAILVWLLLYLTHNPSVNWCWFLIPLVGCIASPVMARRERRETGVVSYSDRLISQMWTILGVSFVALTAFCLAFSMIAGIDCWASMLAYSLIAAPIGEIVSGVALKESSMKWGGVIALVTGLFTLCCVIGGVVLYAVWYMPLYIFAFVVMMIIPGHIINRKAAKTV